MDKVELRDQTEMDVCIRQRGMRRKTHSWGIRLTTGKRPSLCVTLPMKITSCVDRSSADATYLSCKTATPGNAFPSRNSREAPPSVETCVMRSQLPPPAPP